LSFQERLFTKLLAVLNKLLLTIFVSISFAFATVLPLQWKTDGVCCHWGGYDPYDVYILEPGFAPAREDFMNFRAYFSLSISLRGVYDDYLYLNPGLEGTVTIKFTVDREGTEIL